MHDASHRGAGGVVYTTGIGRICPDCRRPAKECICTRRQPTPKGDGVLRILRDRRNRRGKTVTVVTGVPGNEAALEELAGTLKRLCGSGGTAKDGVIEIQGDHRDLVAEKLTAMGYRVKLAGG